MEWETYEALKEYYKDDMQTLVYCLIWLKGATEDDRLIDRINCFIEDNDYCCNCGTKLETHEIHEVHTELCGNPIEILYESYCPICDQKGIEDDRIKEVKQ